MSDIVMNLCMWRRCLDILSRKCEFMTCLYTQLLPSEQTDEVDVRAKVPAPHCEHCDIWKLYPGLQAWQIDGSAHTAQPVGQARKLSDEK